MAMKRTLILFIILATGVILFLSGCYTLVIIPKTEVRYANADENDYDADLYEEEIIEGEEGDSTVIHKHYYYGDFYPQDVYFDPYWTSPYWWHYSSCWRFRWGYYDPWWGDPWYCGYYYNSWYWLLYLSDTEEAAV